MSSSCRGCWRSTPVPVRCRYSDCDRPARETLFASRRHQRHPLADEIAGRQRLRCPRQTRARRRNGHARARRHASPQARRSQIPGQPKRHGGAIGRVRWNEVCDIAHHEQFARTRIEDHFGRDPRIAAADHHDFGGLAALGEFAVAILLHPQPPGRETRRSLRSAAAENSWLFASRHHDWPCFAGRHHRDPAIARRATAAEHAGHSSGRMTIQIRLDLLRKGPVSP